MILAQLPVKRALSSYKKKYSQKSEGDVNESIGDERKIDLSVLGVRTVKKFINNQNEFQIRK